MTQEYSSILYNQFLLLCPSIMQVSGFLSLYTGRVILYSVTVSLSYYSWVADLEQTFALELLKALKFN